MTRLCIFAAVLALTLQAIAQTPSPETVTCSKTITFAAAEGGQPVPAIPKFAAKWIGKSKHVAGYPEMCLSQIPSSRSTNYVVIFSTSEASFDGLTPTAHTYSSTAPPEAGPAVLTSYGGTWNYSYSGRQLLPTTSSLDLQKVDDSKKVLVIRAYNQQGRSLAHYNVDGNHNREKILEMVLADIHRDVPEKVDHRRIAAPLSVYYINCDVDSPGSSALLAAGDPPPVRTDSKPDPAPAPPAPPTLSFSSNPSGADIYLDGSYVGHTPLTSNVSPGEHVVRIYKADYGNWQKKVQVTAGDRKITAVLERKFLNLSSSE